MATVTVPNKAALKKYGMTTQDWLDLLAYQDGKCSICRRTLTRLRVPVVDHNHKTGAVRGLLCMPCNHAVGVLHDDAVWLHSAAYYLRTPPAPVVFKEDRLHENAPPKGQA